MQLRLDDEVVKLTYEEVQIGDICVYDANKCEVVGKGNGNIIILRSCGWAITDRASERYNVPVKFKGSSGWAISRDEMIRNSFIRQNREVVFEL